MVHLEIRYKWQQHILHWGNWLQLRGGPSLSVRQEFPVCHRPHPSLLWIQLCWSQASLPNLLRHVGSTLPSPPINSCQSGAQILPVQNEVIYTIRISHIVPMIMKTDGRCVKNTPVRPLCKSCRLRGARERLRIYFFKQVLQVILIIQGVWETLPVCLAFSHLKFSRIRVCKSQGRGRGRRSHDQFPVSLLSALQELRNTTSLQRSKRFPGKRYNENNLLLVDRVRLYEGDYCISYKDHKRWEGPQTRWLLAVPWTDWSTDLVCARHSAGHLDKTRKKLTAWYKQPVVQSTAQCQTHGRCLGSV